jgi:serine/threonine protein kinase
MQYVVEIDDGDHNENLFHNLSLQHPNTMLRSDADGAAGTNIQVPVATIERMATRRNDISIQVGELIASGSFASVYKVYVNWEIAQAQAERSVPQPLQHRRSSGITLTSGFDDFDTIDDLLVDEEDVFDCHGPIVTSSHRSYHSHRSSAPPQTPYALKRLNAVTLDSGNPSKFSHGIRGMRFEAQVLSEILPKQHGRSHPHIIQLFGMSSNFMDDPASGYLILELLVDTLDKRIKRLVERRNMMNDDKNNNSSSSDTTKSGDMKNSDTRETSPHRTHAFRCQRFFSAKQQQKKSTAWKEQLARTKHIGFGIARAMKYLHQHRVLYRDLKPANVGFDANGVVKLFDFDLSRRFLHGEDVDVTTTLRQLTGCIGTLRYMSPECAFGHPYGFSSDVHSFGLLLWETCTLHRPYIQIRSEDELVKHAFLGNERPNLRYIVSPELSRVLQNCWSPFPNHRPTFAAIVDTLGKLITSGHNDNGSPIRLGNMVARRKSAM